MFSSLTFQVGLDIATAISVIAAALSFIRAQSIRINEERKLSEQRAVKQLYAHIEDAARDTISSAISSAKEIFLTGANLQAKWRRIDKENASQVKEWIDDFWQEYDNLSDKVILLYFREVQLKLEMLPSRNDQVFKQRVVSVRKILEDAAKEIEKNRDYVMQMKDKFYDLYQKNSFPQGVNVDSIPTIMISNAFLHKSEPGQQVPVSSIYAICTEAYKKIYFELKRIENIEPDEASSVNGF